MMAFTYFLSNVTLVAFPANVNSHKLLLLVFNVVSTPAGKTCIKHRETNKLYLVIIDRAEYYP